MTKRRVQCPECGHRHTIQHGVRAKTTGVRSRRVTGNQFEYTVTIPEHMDNEDENEPVRFSSTGGDMIMGAGFGILVGGTCGLIVSSIFPGYEGQAVAIGAGIATTYAWGWLQAETNQRLKSVLPYFVRIHRDWQAGAAEAASNEVSLTIDHRYRDGLTEAGRTIEYFGTLPVDVDRFNRWAVAVLGSDTMPPEPLAHTSWVGLKKGKLFSRTEYEPLLAHLAAGGTVMNLPGKGHVLTGGGRRAIKQHLKATTPPTGAEAHVYA